MNLYPILLIILIVLLILSAILIATSSFLLSYDNKKIKGGNPPLTNGLQHSIHTDGILLSPSASNKHERATNPAVYPAVYADADTDADENADENTAGYTKFQPNLEVKSVKMQSLYPNTIELNRESYKKRKSPDFVQLKRNGTGNNKIKFDKIDYGKLFDDAINSKEYIKKRYTDKSTTKRREQKSLSNQQIDLLNYPLIDLSIEQQPINLLNAQPIEEQLLDLSSNELERPLEQRPLDQHLFDY